MTADGPVVATTEERTRRRRASRIAAAVAALFFLFTLGALIAYGPADGGDAQTKTTDSTATKTEAGKTATNSTRTVETTIPGDDQSLLSQALGTGAAPLILQLLLASLGAFAAGAVVQRVWLGEYGVTVGPVTVPPLAPISTETTEKAADLISESPSFADFLGPGPRRRQPHPQFRDIEDDRLGLLSIRIELEERLRDLAGAAGIDRDVAVAKLPERLVVENVLDHNAAAGLRQLLDIGNRIAAGAEVEPDAAQSLRENAIHVLYALVELRQRVLEERDGRA